MVRQGAKKMKLMTKPAKRHKKAARPGGASLPLRSNPVFGEIARRSMQKENENQSKWIML